MWFVAILIWIVSTGCCSYDIASGILTVLCVLLVTGPVVAAILLRAGAFQIAGKAELVTMAVPSDINRSLPLRRDNMGTDHGCFIEN